MIINFLFKRFILILNKYQLNILRIILPKGVVKIEIITLEHLFKNEYRRLFNRSFQ